jgi:hypothetical protein
MHDVHHDMNLGGMINAANTGNLFFNYNGGGLLSPANVI